MEVSFQVQFQSRFRTNTAANPFPKSSPKEPNGIRKERLKMMTHHWGLGIVLNWRVRWKVTVVLAWAGGNPAQRWKYKREGEIVEILSLLLPSHSFEKKSM